MTTFTALPNGDVDQDSPVTQPLLTLLRDNPIAIAEGAANSPVTAAGWHPYNKVLNGDANTGLIYDFAVSGAVADVVTPNFVDGYEYRIRWEGLSCGGNTAFRIELYLTTGAVYGSAITIFSAATPSQTFSGLTELPYVRRSVLVNPITGWNVVETTGSAALTSIATSCHQAAQKRDRARFSFASAQTIDGGKMFMDKRLAVY